MEYETYLYNNPGMAQIYNPNYYGTSFQQIPYQQPYNPYHQPPQNQMTSPTHDGRQPIIFGDSSQNVISVYVFLECTSQCTGI